METQAQTQVTHRLADLIENSVEVGYARKKISNKRGPYLSIQVLNLWGAILENNFKTKPTHPDVNWVVNGVTVPQDVQEKRAARRESEGKDAYAESIDGGGLWKVKDEDGRVYRIRSLGKSLLFMYWNPERVEGCDPNIPEYVVAVTKNPNWTPRAAGSTFDEGDEMPIQNAPAAPPVRAAAEKPSTKPAVRSAKTAAKETATAPATQKAEDDPFD